MHCACHIFGKDIEWLSFQSTGVWRQFAFGCLLKHFQKDVIQMRMGITWLEHLHFTQHTHTHTHIYIYIYIIRIRVVTVVPKLSYLLKFSVLYHSFLFHVAAQMTVAYIYLHFFADWLQGLECACALIVSEQCVHKYFHTSSCCDRLCNTYITVRKYIIYIYIYIYIYIIVNRC